MKRKRPSKHVRRVRTKKGSKRVVVNRNVKKRRNFGMGVFVNPNKNVQIESFPSKFKKLGVDYVYADDFIKTLDGDFLEHKRKRLKPALGASHNIRDKFEQNLSKKMIKRGGYVYVDRYGVEEERLKDKHRIKLGGKYRR